MNRSDFDPKSHLGGGVSISPGTEVGHEDEVEGGWIDLGDYSVSPVVSALCQTSAFADESGDPESYGITFRIQQADTAGGDGDEDCPIQSNFVATGSPAPDTQMGWATARRSKRYCRVVAVGAFTGGEGPSLLVGATILAQKYEGP